MAVNLFIDTNIFLAFYHFSGEDLEELKKLAVLVEKDKIRLLVPQQVIDEFRRNRDTKIADALKKLRDQKLGLQFPQMCKDYPEYARLRSLQKAYETIHAALVAQALADAESGTLKADDIISSLFEHGEVIATSSDIAARAALRMDMGNPPGKNSSLGDAVNWECLLESASSAEPLHFVTDDSDYVSPLDAAAFNSFLLREWSDKTRPDLVFHKRLSAFFAKEFQQIKLASEAEKDLLIQDLAESPNFITTHAIVAKLRQFSDFTLDQANAILSAAYGNSQVGWIAGDDDVRELLKAAIIGWKDQLDPQMLIEVVELMEPEPEPEASGGVPF